MSELLAEIEIPKFITKVKLSNKRRRKYYKYRPNKRKKWYPRNIPKTYKNKLDDGIYFLDKKGYLREKENNKKILANPQAAGTPKYEVLSGNNFMSGYGSPHIRAKLVGELKNFYRPFVQEYAKQHGSITKFPLKVEWDCYTTVEEDPNWDADNLHFYYKYFQDALHESEDPNGKKLIQLIPEDSVKYIISPPGPRIIPVDNWNERKFIFKLYYDNRKELRRKPWVDE